MVHPEDELLVAANHERIEAEGRTDGTVVTEWRSKLAEQLSVATTLRIAEQRAFGCGSRI